MPQDAHFAHAAGMFSLRYCAPQSQDDLEAALAEAWKAPAATVIELKVNETEGAQMLRSLLNEVSRL